MGDLIEVLAPIVVGTVVAGLSAVVKGVVERRDARVTAERQLALATTRTAFIKEWLAVSNDVNDPVYAEDAAGRAKADLEQAYTEANEALAHGRSVIEESWHDKVVDQLRWLLLIRGRHTTAARFVVIVCYVLVIFMWLAMVLPEEAGDPDALPLWQDALVATLVTIFLRAVAGVVVGALDARGATAIEARPAASGSSIQPTTEIAIAPPPVQGG